MDLDGLQVHHWYLLYIYIYPVFGDMQLFVSLLKRNRVPFNAALANAPCFLVCHLIHL
jgi:hypothetical protein